jgi:hypothetical protein
MTTLPADIFDAFWKDERSDLIALIKNLQADIGDDDRASDDPDDDIPSMQITIAMSDDPKKGWSYQTGDNSYTGNCYGSPYWGTATLTRDDDPATVADALIDNLSQSMY